MAHDKGRWPVHNRGVHSSKERERWEEKMEDAEQGERGGGRRDGGKGKREKDEGGKRDEKKGSLHHMGERRRKGERKREGKKQT